MKQHLRIKEHKKNKFMLLDTWNWESTILLWKKDNR